jgi:hypothetical protein
MAAGFTRTRKLRSGPTMGYYHPAGLVSRAGKE